MGYGVLIWIDGGATYPNMKVTWGPYTVRHSKTIILARVQEEQQFKATPATMTSTDFRAEGSLGGTVHRP